MQSLSRFGKSIVEVMNLVRILTVEELVKNIADAEFRNDLEAIRFIQNMQRQAKELVYGRIDISQDDVFDDF